ncbi:hypothetical protein CEXT_577731 [Caerostris extrusa]|uniref:Uncharacterized protein n=1 Tax=Caerostris extrusa TaxID=172846 RepID=A0AAV4SS83_CAEEX|nr:hypothetical protein CEXT_577731 [Caerostris extrusa]
MCLQLIINTNGIPHINDWTVRWPLAFHNPYPQINAQFSELQKYNLSISCRLWANRINPRNPMSLLFTFLTALLLFRSLFANHAFTTQLNQTKQTKCSASPLPFRNSAICERTSSLILLFEAWDNSGIELFHSSFSLC